MGENIGPLWRRKYYIIPPQGLHNITSSIEAQNNRSVTHHSVLTIGDDITQLPKTMVEIVIGLQKGHVIYPKNYGGVSNWFSE